MHVAFHAVIARRSVVQSLWVHPREGDENWCYPCVLVSGGEDGELGTRDASEMGRYQDEGSLVVVRYRRFSRAHHELSFRSETTPRVSSVGFDDSSGY